MVDDRYRTEPIATPNNWKTLEHHPSADVERMMNSEEAEKLRESISERYDKNRPIVLIMCEDGQLRVLDGRNRKRECALLDDEGLLKAPPPFDVFVGSALPVEYKTYAFRLNESQKTLTKRENADRALRIKERWAVEHAERNAKQCRENAAKGGEIGGRGRSIAASRESRDAAIDPAPASPKHSDSCGPSISKASEATGIGKDEISQLARLKRFAPDLFDRVMNEEITRTQALEELKERARAGFAETGKGLPPADGTIPKNDKDFYLPRSLKKRAKDLGQANGASSTEETVVTPSISSSASEDPKETQLQLLTSSVAPETEGFLERQRREMAEARASAKKTNDIIEKHLQDCKEGNDPPRAPLDREMILRCAAEGVLQSYPPDDLVIMFRLVFVGLPTLQRQSLLELLMKEA